MTQTIEPIDFIESFLAGQKEVRKVFLSTYRYHPQSLIDDRIRHGVAKESLRTAYDALRDKLREGEEIAFHSLMKIATSNANRHIPLVDFQSREQSRVEDTAQVLIDEYKVERGAMFASGHSFHLYLGVLLTQAVWVKFMGRLLLLNSRDDPVLTDARWIGHRLMAGYGALRWSANTSPYTNFGPPRLVREW
jgi:hypothetical protein